MNENVYFLISFTVVYPKSKFASQHIIEIEGYNNLKPEDKAKMLQEEIESFKFINYPENVVEITDTFQLK